MQHPASNTLAAFAHFYLYLANKSVNPSNIAIAVYWVTAISMLLASIVVRIPTFTLTKCLGRRGRMTGDWIPFAIAATLDVYTGLYFGPLVGFTLLYPGASALAEACSVKGFWPYVEPCMLERGRLSVLGLMEPGGRRALLEVRVWHNSGVLVGIAAMCFLFFWMSGPWCCACEASEVPKSLEHERKLVAEEV